MGNKKNIPLIDKELFNAFKNTILLLNNKERFKLISLFFNIVVISILETFTILSIIPVIQFLFNDNSEFQFLIELNIQINSFLLFSIYILFIFLTFILKILLTKSIFKNIGIINHYISSKIYSFCLKNENIYFLQSEGVSNFINEFSYNLTKTLSSVMELILLTNNIFSLTLLLVFLIIVNPYLTTILVLLIGLTYYFISIDNKKFFIDSGKELILNNKKLIKNYTETFNLIKQIKTNSKEEKYSKTHRIIDYPIRKIIAKTGFRLIAPRYYLEFITFVSIIIIIFFQFIYLKNSIESILISISLIIASFQKILPLIQRIYNGYLSINGMRESIIIINKLIIRSKKRNI